MKFMFELQERWIRYFIHPKAIKKQVTFKEALVRVRRIAVYCPDTTCIGDMHKHLSDLFANPEIMFIVPGLPSFQDGKLPSKIIVRPIENAGLLKISKNSVYQKLSGTRTDLFIDTDPSPILLSMLLSRTLQPVISFGFKKPAAEHYYNLLYGTDPEQTREITIGRLFEFFEKLMSG
ncbi:hypothetical protein JW948_00385 [bacterium]|nr:hypothetical protein [bacterium]